MTVNYLKDPTIQTKKSGENVVFALNPQSSKWAGAGFTSESHWWVWKNLGCSPEESNPEILFPLRDKDLHALVGKYDRSQWGWRSLNTSRITNMDRLFAFSKNFNEPISSWDTGKVSNMQRSFLHAECFNQNLGDWNISEVTNMDEMFLGSGISLENLSKTLVGWAETAKRNSVKRNVILSRLPYSMENLSGETRAATRFLINAFEWKIGFSLPRK